MKLKFKKLIIDNFLSFGHAEIDLADCGYTLIKGINQNPKDGAKSNGSGKSTIFSALCYALTGETIQGLSSNLNNIFTNGNMSVTLIFSADKDNYEITRSRDNKNKADLKIQVNDVDKSGKGVRESQEILNSLLPELTSDLIGEVIIIGQGMPHKFSNNTPSGRKDLLEKLSHSDYMLEDIKERIEKRSDELNEQKNNITLNKTKKETEKIITEKSIAEKQTELLKYKQKPDFNKEKDDINKNILLTQNQLGDLNSQLNKTSFLLEKANNDLLELNKAKNDEISNEAEEFNKHNLDVKTLLTEKRTEKRTLENEIKTLESIKDVCPMCKQKLPHVHKQDTSVQKNKVELLTEEIKTLEDKNNKQQEAYRLNTDDIKAKYVNEELKIKENKQTYDNEKNLINNNISKLNQTLTDLKIKLIDVNKNEELFDQAKKQCEESLNSLNDNLANLNNEILYIISKEEEVKTHIDVLTKINTLVKRDFRGILLSNIIKYIDQKSKNYAKDIFGTNELDFNLDGNNLNITYCKKPLEALSGGEQQKVDLIIQFAIRAMMEEYTGFTSNIIVLDEILDNLDSVGCDSILNFITNKLSDIESIFIISHHADTLNIGNDATITVVKNQGGVSYIL